MTHFYRVFTIALTLSSLTLWKPVNAQSTWSQVHTILSTNCTGSGCHSGSRPDFDVTLSDSVLYAALVGVTPINPAASAKGNKYIDPGYPDRSFLLRKVANCLSGDLALDQAEGNHMPDGRTPLAAQDVELIRQWISHAAPFTGNVVNKATIDEYYTVGGVPQIERPEPPKSCEGFQVHMGPFFFAPGEESEWFQKYDLKVADTLEVTGLELFFNDESHHFILRKFQPGTAASWPQGVTPLNPLTAFDSDKDYVMAWQDNDVFMLPNGTAYFWEPNTSLDLNLHVFNYHSEILLGEVYINIYTQPKGNAIKQMKSSLINNLNFFVPNNNTPTTFSSTDNMTNASIWTLTSHTHKYGIDYNIFFKNAAGGGKGKQIFDGTFNYKQGFDSGVYDWEHPPTARYEPLLDMTDTINNGTKPAGLIHEATYKNNGPNGVGFGFTTAQEMMIYYVQYVDGHYDIPATNSWTSTCSTEVFKDACSNDSTIGIINIANANFGMNLYPNPTSGITKIEYSLANNAQFVNLEVVNMLGEVVTVLVNNEQQQTGSHAYQFDVKNNSNGIYFVRLYVDGKVSTQKLIFAGK